jgi:hypothetical protein
MPVSAELVEFCEAVTREVGQRAKLAGAQRSTEMVELVLIHWPAYHLNAIAKISAHHAALAHAMKLSKCQVREHWEIRHGMGPLWAILLATLCNQVQLVILERWFRNADNRAQIARLARELAKRERPSAPGA